MGVSHDEIVKKYW